MKRRDFVKKATLGAAATGGIVVGCGGGSSTEAGGPAVQTRPTVRWRLASSFPRSLDTIFIVAETMSQRVADLTDGRFQIRAYPAGEIVPGLEVLDTVQKGTVQVGHTASYYFIGKNPALAFDSAVPFGLTSRQQNAWFYYGGGLELMRELLSDFNIINFPGGNTGTQMGGWFRREINSLADVRGLKMRIPGLGGKVMSELGATALTIAGGEIYQALERGAIDAAEWVGPYDDEKLGFHKVAPYYYYPGWWEPGPGLSFYVNQDAWNQLPTVYQQAFEVAAREANLDMLANYDAKNPQALVRLRAENINFRPFSDDIMQAARDTSFELMEAEAASSPGYNKVFSNWKKFREDSYRWFGLAEQTYARFAFS
jgi:TRAP-type mannitol/chloroaromatic compound transport system substrate-binding protein